uniref:Uncharacterized protein n=1 Tax=Arundo donax TaxID=35708 RepID=A0A0A9HJ87_ARUDO
MHQTFTGKTSYSLLCCIGYLLVWAQIKHITSLALVPNSTSIFELCYIILKPNYISANPS